jgi:hypothetical protein
MGWRLSGPCMVINWLAWQVDQGSRQAGQARILIVRQTQRDGGRDLSSPRLSVRTVPGGFTGDRLLQNLWKLVMSLRLEQTAAERLDS